MIIRRSALLSKMACVLLLVAPVCEAQARKAKETSAAPGTAANGEADHWAARIQFRFDILDLVTDH